MTTALMLTIAAAGIFARPSCGSFAVAVPGRCDALVQVDLALFAFTTFLLATQLGRTKGPHRPRILYGRPP